MCHTLDISMIRKFAVILPKIMKRIYGKILVNSAGIEMVKYAYHKIQLFFIYKF